MISRIIQTEVNVICRSRMLRRLTLTQVWIIIDIMRMPNPRVILYIHNNHTKMQAMCASKRTHAINLAKFCYQFVIFARFEVVTSSAPNNYFLGHLRPIIHSIWKKWRHRCWKLRINWSMLTNKEREWSLNV